MVWRGTFQTAFRQQSVGVAWRRLERLCENRARRASCFDVRKCRGGRGIISAVEILVVDDEQRMRSLIKDFLKQKGYNIVSLEELISEENN